MSLEWNDIHHLLIERARDRLEIIGEAEEVRRRYNADIVLPLPDHENAPTHLDYSPNMVLDTVENLAMSAASTTPKIYAPQVGSGTAPMKRATKRRQVWQGVWDKSRSNMLFRRMYRHLAGYGIGAVMAAPNLRDGCTKIQVYDPLTAYPEEIAPEEARAPDNVGFISVRSSEWIMVNYPDAIGNASDKLPPKLLQEWQIWEVVEWYDEDNIVFGTLGPIDRDGRHHLIDQALHSRELLRVPNRAGMVPGYMPKRVTLDRIAAHVSKIVGIQDLFGYITAIDVEASKKAVHPDLYGIAADGRDPEIITNDGQWQDGRTGQMNLVKGIQAIGNLVSAPGPMTGPILDRLERSSRIIGGNPAINSGELNGAIRSGNTINQMMAAASDPRIKELHEIAEVAMEVVNVAVAEVDRGYFGSKKISMYSGKGTDRELVEYRPSDIWETHVNSVEYDMAGMDVVSVGVALSGMNAQRLMSRKTAIERHPFTRNPDQEYIQVTVEELVDSQLAAIRQMAQAGALAVTDLNSLIRKIEGGQPLVDAWDAVQREAQERQAEEATEEGAPETQPGAEAPGSGIEQPPPQEPVAGIPGPNQSVANLRELSNALVAPVRGGNAVGPSR